MCWDLTGLDKGEWKGPIIQALFDEKKMLHQVTKGLAYLHSRDKPIIHRDIKPSNILIYAPDEKTAAGGLVKPKMKIADFGLSTTLISGQADLSTRNNTDPDGTRGWIAPELYEKGCRYNCKVDIFPLGCVFGYTLSKEQHHPFGEKEERAYRIKHKKEPIKILALADLKEPYSKKCTLELIWSMIKMNPEERLTAEDILNHEFFTGSSDGPTSPSEFNNEVVIDENTSTNQQQKSNINVALFMEKIYWFYFLL